MTPVAERLERRLEFEAMSGCWLWSGACSREGYGHIRIGAKVCLAHRVSYALSHGEVPADLCVCHRCDTPACVNPEHLFLGTNAANVRDRSNKGRSRGGANAGIAHPMARLGPDEIRWISQQRERGVRQREIAASLGVSQAHISNVLSGKRWAK
jgi:hypothetical protein